MKHCKKYRNLGLCLPVLGVCVLAACGGGGGGGSSDAPAQLTLAITDGPVDAADAVVVAFNSIEIQGPERKTFTLDDTATINLLDFQNGETMVLLDGEEMTAGEYQWIRLGVDESASYIEIDGQQFPLEIPSGSQTGLKLNRGFTLAAGNISQFTIDFDLRKSVHQEGTGDYKLRPTVRLVDNLEVGTISGSVSDELVMAAECNNGDNNDAGNAVYVFQGADASVLDIQGLATDPLTSASVVYNDQTAQYEFTVAFVAAGDYTLAFTCDALLDDPLVDDSALMMFSAPANITVTAEEESSIVF